MKMRITIFRSGVNSTGAAMNPPVEMVLNANVMASNGLYDMMSRMTAISNVRIIYTAMNWRAASLNLMDLLYAPDDPDVSLPNAVRVPPPTIGMSNMKIRMITIPPIHAQVDLQNRMQSGSCVKSDTTSTPVVVNPLADSKSASTNVMPHIRNGVIPNRKHDNQRAAIIANASGGRTTVDILYLIRMGIPRRRPMMMGRPMIDGSSPSIRATRRLGTMETDRATNIPPQRNMMEFSLLP